MYDSATLKSITFLVLKLKIRNVIVKEEELGESGKIGNRLST